MNTNGESRDLDSGMQREMGERIAGPEHPRQGIQRVTLQKFKCYN